MSSAMNAQIVEPYASALMALAKDIDKVNTFAENARSFLVALKETPELQSFIANPILKSEDKKEVLQTICGKGIDTYFLNFLLILVDRRRILFLAPICEEFVALQRKLNNIVLAEVTSATALTRSQEDAIADQVKAMAKADQVELDITTDTELIGGVVIKIGSQVFDASLRGQLRRIGIGLMGTN
ncbi:MAG: F0F1 ATP synthase subunit delta [Limnothrix sp. RL_2_0]|nr:F0F1 ATP synthase subunit delta [Limnothrix sp. RL_2_0]